MESNLEYFIEDIGECINEVVVGDENTEYAMSDICSMENNQMFALTSQMDNYESDDSLATIPMTNSCSDFNISQDIDVSREHTNTDQFKDMTNIIELRSRQSTAIKMRAEHSNENDALMKINKPNDCIDINTDTASEKTSKQTDIPPEFYEGRLLWCKLKSYPWWPCMIYHSPENQFYRKNYIHIVYLGPNIDRGWMSIKDIFSYDGKDKYDLLIDRLKSENTSQKVLKSYCVKNNYQWDKAWKEAEAAMKLSLVKRIKNHGIHYKNNGDESSDCDSDESSSTDEQSCPAAVEDVVATIVPENIPEVLYDKSPSIVGEEEKEPIEPPGESIDRVKKSAEVSVAKETVPIEEDREEESDAIAVSADLVIEAPIVVKEIDNVVVLENRSVSKPKRQSGALAVKRAQNNVVTSVKVEKSDVKLSSSKNESNLEFRNLKAPTFGGIKKSTTSLCALCLRESREVVGCTGSCGLLFHLDCMRLLLGHLDTATDDCTKCIDCNRDRRRCFACTMVIGDPRDVVKCSIGNCQRHYHSACLNNETYQNLTVSRSKRQNGTVSIVCPSHTCLSCHLDNPASVRHSPTHLHCLLCPAAYHRGDWCLPAGSRQLSDSSIICPQHMVGSGAFDWWTLSMIGCVRYDDESGVGSVVIKKEMSDSVVSMSRVQVTRHRMAKPVNVSWCFLCSSGGDLVCCEKCPASFHAACLTDAAPPSLTVLHDQNIPDRLVCEECRLGRWQRYGEICWLKIGNYRWWPAQVVHSSRAPPKVLQSPHRDGQFLVLFFGTDDYHWCSRTHAFAFDDGDDDSAKVCRDGGGDSSRRTLLEKAYKVSMKIAGTAYRTREQRWTEIIGRGNKPNHYRTIKNNIPIGDVQINKAIDFNMCECRPGKGKNDADPCGVTSDCINVTLMYECDPLHCRNGSKCRNQRFVLRQYPRQEVFSTADRGMGLRIKEFVKKGTFINEYIGEVIDEAEAKRRLKTSHANNISNFYMMELDGGRIIDAGPAANISRFMNHSCSPNVFTQKWLVNGDTRVGVFALRNIGAEEELTFNYHFLSLGQTKIPCKCGAPNCSGFLGVAPKSETSTHLRSSGQKQAKKRIHATSSTNRRQSQNQRIKIPKLAKESPKAEQLALMSRDSTCYVCKGTESNVHCCYDHCPRTYHSECLELAPESAPSSTSWLCPWHFCDDCGRLSSTLCSFCTVSFCDSHLGDRVLSTCIDNNSILTCQLHRDFYRLSSQSLANSCSNTGTESPPSVSI